MSNSKDSSLSASPVKRALKALKEMQAKIARLEHKKREPIAVIGMGCRFPGGAVNPDTFWELLEQGKDAVGEVPADRWDMTTYYDPKPGVPGKISTRNGSFIQDVEGFDAQFFGISRREAMAMDPQQRLLLEVSWEALEYAGQAPERLKESLTGVYVGMMTQDYSYLVDENNFDLHTGSGYETSFSAGRLSYSLGLQGPSMVVTTACSASSVSIHLACQALRQDECNLALAGGVNLILTPRNSIYLSQIRAISSDGRCRPFDASADGYGRGEGCGVLVLKRLSDAVEDGDPVLGLIRGSAVNHNGPSGGLSMPGGPAQERLIKQALENAAMQPEEIGYLEVHSTGTAMGDPIEALALGEVFGHSHNHEKPLRLGSVKTNFGHLEAASGVAGVIKCLLMLQHKKMTPMLHLQDRNQSIPWNELPFEIPTELTDWAEDQPTTAGISSFGRSGINAHIIVEAAPSRERSTRQTGNEHHQLNLSAKSEKALKQLAAAYADELEKQQHQLADVCYTASVGRNHMEHRLSLVAQTRVDAVGQLRAYVAGKEQPSLYTGQISERPGKTAFLFTGEGMVYPGMGLELYTTATVFRDTVEQCCLAVCTDLMKSLTEILFSEPGTSTLDQPKHRQTAQFAISLALANQLEDWGIVPDTLMGEGLGELVAACFSGIISLEDALKLVMARVRYHEKLAEGIEDIQAYAAVVRTITFREGVLPVYATQAASIEREMASAEYWIEQVRAPLQTGNTLQAMSAAGVRHFVEVAPNPSLTTRFVGRLSEASAQAYATLDAENDQQLKQTLAQLYVLGMPLNHRKQYTGQEQLIHLPSYPFQRESLWVTTRETVGNAQREELSANPLVFTRAHPESLDLIGQPGPLWLPVTDLPKDPKLAETICSLSREYGLAPGAVSQVTGRAYLFVSAARDAFFYANRREKLLVAQIYTGPEEAFEPLVTELRGFVQEQNLELMLIVEREAYRARLEQMDFSSTTFGVWQNLHDLENYSLAGKKMRRLRYAVNRYEQLGNCRVVEHTLGSDPEVEARLVEIIDLWTAAKERGAGPLTTHLKEAILGGWPENEARYFLVYRDEQLDGFFVMTPLPMYDTQLMDVEFYGPEVPMGAMEFGVIQVLEILKAEGKHRFSLGLTPFTQMEPHPNQDEGLFKFLHQVHEQGHLNGDANFQFKNKFRPENEPAWLCRPHGLDVANMTEFLMMMGDPTNHRQAKPEQTKANAAIQVATSQTSISMVPEDERPAWVIGYLHKLIGSVLETPVKNLRLAKRIDALGVDSLTIMEIRNRIEADLQVDLPTVHFFDYPTIPELAEMVLEHLEEDMGLNREILLTLPAAERPTRVTNYLHEMIAAILQTPVVELSLTRSIDALGVDSLTVMELRNRIEAELEVDLPAVRFFDYPTIPQLAEMVLELVEEATHIDSLAELAPEARSSQILAYLHDLVSGILRTPKQQLSTSTRIDKLGVDSLTVMEINNQIKADLGVDLPTVLFFDYPTIEELAGTILEHAGFASNDASPSPEPQYELHETLQVEELSDEEVSAMLAQMMRGEEELLAVG